MGLDMFMSKRKIQEEEVAYWRKANQVHHWLEQKLAPNTGFVDLKDYIVPKEVLVELRNACQDVIDHSKLVDGKIKVVERLNSQNEWDPIYEKGKVIDNPRYAKEHMPTCSGFFFGSTDYDEGYIDDLIATVDQISKILETTDFNKEQIFYYASW